MNWIIILVALFLVLVFVGGITAAMPKPGRSKEDIEREKEREEEKVTSVGQWLLIYIGTMIPVFNIVLLFVLAFKKYYTNLTIKNWARSILIITLVVMLITIALTVIAFILYGEQIKEFLLTYE